MIGKLLRTATQQAIADLRTNIAGISFVNFILTPGVILGISAFLGDRDVAGGTISVGQYLISGVIGAYGTMLIIQIANEVYLERLNGTMLRVKTLPHGVPSWMLGKSMSAGSIIALQAIIIGVLGVPIMLGAPEQIPVVIGVGLVSIIAHLPLAFLVATLVRGVWTALGAYGIGLVLFIFSGAAFPLNILPTWAETTGMIFPGYWATAISQSLILDDALLGALRPETYPLWVGVAVIAAWVIVGSALAVKLTEKTFRKETFGSLLSTNVQMERYMGMS